MGAFWTVVTAGGALRETLRGAAFRPFQQATGCAVQDISLPVGELLRELRRQALVGRVQWDGGRARRAARGAGGTADAGAVRGSRRGRGWRSVRDRYAGAGVPHAGVRGRLSVTWGEFWSANLPERGSARRIRSGCWKWHCWRMGSRPGRLSARSGSRVRFARPAAGARPGLVATERAGGRGAGTGGGRSGTGYGGQLRAAIAGGADAVVAPLPEPVLPLVLALPQRATNADVARDFADYVRGARRRRCGGKDTGRRGRCRLATWRSMWGGGGSRGAGAGAV
ncbi:MAG: hypothetical protein U0232_28520 [Thermomicrobiales bacterium]